MVVLQLSANFLIHARILHVRFTVQRGPHLPPTAPSVPVVEFVQLSPKLRNHPLVDASALMRAVVEKCGLIGGAAL
jgi:hypothetical protein